MNVSLAFSVIGLPYAEDSKDYEDNYENIDDNTDNDADNEITYAPKFQSESSHQMINEGKIRKKNDIAKFCFKKIFEIF